MLAYLYNEERRLELREVPRPRESASNAIMKVQACSICGTDLRTHRFGSDHIAVPRIVGHEMTGELVHIGKDLPGGFYPGMRVNVAPAVGCGFCPPCRKGYTNLCDDLRTLGFQYDGGFAEYMEIPEEIFIRGNVLPIPDRLGPEDVVLAEPVACVVNGQEPLKIGEGDTVAVFGGGFIGCMHVRLALLSGAASVTLLEPNESRRLQAHTLFGAAGDTVGIIDPSGPDSEIHLRESTGGRGFDVVITACSVGSVQSQALSLAAKRGRVSLFGGLPGVSTGYLDSNLIHYKELAVHGVHASTAEQNRRVLRWVEDGTLDLRPYISRYFTLADIEPAFVAIEKDNILKAVIKP